MRSTVTSWSFSFSHLTESYVAKIFVESAIKLAEAAEGNVAPIGGPVQLETLV